MTSIVRLSLLDLSIWTLALLFTRISSKGELPSSKLGGRTKEEEQVAEQLKKREMEGANGDSTNPAQEPDLDAPDRPGLELAQFAAGCFWGVELAFQRLEGVARTEVGYSQGHLPDPTYDDVCSGKTGHAEVVRVQFDPSVCPYASLLSLFWSRHDPTTLNRQGNDVGTQYRSGIYYYGGEQARLARESKEEKQREVGGGVEVVTEILPARRFYRAEEYHQQYLEEGGGRGVKQSARKGCNDPIRCYG